MTRYEPEDAGTYGALVDLIAARHPRELFSTDGSLVDDQVAALLAGRRIATAESCTAGLVAARLTERPGSSDYFPGGVVAYANEVKEGLLDVDPGSDRAPWRGVAGGGVGDGGGRCRGFGADLAVSVTGVAGPGGGTEEKPVGTVCFCVRAADGSSMARDVLLPGGRADIRERSTTVVHAHAAPCSSRRGGERRLSPRGHGCSWRSTFPRSARAALAGWRDALVAGRDDLRPVVAAQLSRDARLPRVAGRGETERIGRVSLGAAEGGRCPCWHPARCAACRPATRGCSPSTSEDPGGRAGEIAGRVGAALEREGLTAARSGPSGRI